MAIRFLPAKETDCHGQFANWPRNDDISVTKSLSSADETEIFKGLLDKGIITQKEFDAKKKQLLGL